VVRPQGPLGGHRDLVQKPGVADRFVGRVDIHDMEALGPKGLRSMKYPILRVMRKKSLNQEKLELWFDRTSV
jgi:hypothetical protein